MASKTLRSPSFVRATRSLVISAALALMPALAFVPAHGASPKVLRIGYILSKGSQLGAGADAFAAEISRRTAGRFSIEAYPDAMLGGEVAMIQDVRLGALDLAFVTGAPLPTIVPSVGVFNIPFLFHDAEQARRLLDGPIGSEYLAKFDKAGLVALAWGENGLRHLTSQTDVSTPERLRGLKLRLPQSEAMAAGFQVLGAQIQQIPFNQLYVALQTGTVEAEENPIATILSSHFAQVQKHLALTGHVYDPAVILMSRDAFDTLSDDDRPTFKEAARLAGLASRTFAAEAERTGLATLRAQGMSVQTDVDRDAFATRVAAAAPTWNALYGAAEIERIREAGGYRSTNGGGTSRP